MMKTKTVTLRLDLPASPEELLRGLNDLSVDDPELAAAERRLAAASDSLAAVKADLARLDAETRGLPDAISSGHAAASQLDVALMALRRAAALVEPAERAVALAEAERARATTCAQERALQLVNDRRDQLLKADAVLVAHMNAIDEWIDTMAFRLHSLAISKTNGQSGKFDLRGKCGEYPDRALVLIRVANSSGSHL